MTQKTTYEAAASFQVNAVEHVGQVTSAKELAALVASHPFQPCQPPPEIQFVAPPAEIIAVLASEDSTPPPEEEDGATSASTGWEMLKVRV